MPSKKHAFHDFASISPDILEKYSIACFYGESGSGKSTYIKKMISQYRWKTINYKKWEKSIYSENTLIVIDEVIHFSDYFSIVPLFFWKNKLLIASHVPTCFYAVLRLFWKKVYTVNLEKYPQKIEAYLKSLGYSFSRSSIDLYSKKFKSTYTDIDIILEMNSSGDKNFDNILKKFLKTQHIKMDPST